MITSNFKYSEFEHSNKAIELGIDNKAGDEERENIKDLVINLIQPIRDEFGSITISSGYRCDELNKAVDGSKTSHHKTGQAGDCVFNEANMYDVWEKLKTGDLKFTQAILYKKKGFIHLSYVKTNLKMEMFTK